MAQILAIFLLTIYKIYVMLSKQDSLATGLTESGVVYWKKERAMTTGSITPATLGQIKQILQMFRDALIKANLNKEAAQRLLSNGAEILADLMVLIVRYSSLDNRFQLRNSFELTVPRGYDHGTQLATFAEYEKRKKPHFFNNDISDANFAKATQRLVPGKKYGVRIFKIKARVTSQDCLAFLASQNAILVGAQGVSLARELKQDEFPVGKWTVSFDDKDALWKDAVGYLRVPRAYRHSDGGWSFRLGLFERGWKEDNCLICFCDPD